MTEISAGADPRSRTSLLLIVLAAVVPNLLLPPKPLIQDAGLAITGNKTVQEAPLAQVFVRDFWGVPAEADYGTRSYRPLVSLTYAVQARLFGGQAGLFHPGLHKPRYVFA